MTSEYSAVIAVSADVASEDLLRQLSQLPLRLVPPEVASTREWEATGVVPLITFGPDPEAFVAAARDWRPWVAILPEEDGVDEAFESAGADVVLRLPLERSRLLSALGRCFAGMQGSSPFDR